MAKRRDAKGITDQQERFCIAYIKSLNGSAAAIEAGYSQKTAAVQASDLLSRPNIIAKIQELRDKVNDMAVVDAAYVLKGIKEVTERCMQKVPVMEFNPESGEYTQAVDENGNNVWQFDSKGALKGLELLGKHIGFFEMDNKQRTVLINVARR